MAVSADERRRLKVEIVARVEAGVSIAGVLRALGLRKWTASDWGRGDPLFRADLVRAERIGRHRRLRAFDDARAAAFVARVAAGEAPADLFDQPGMPTRLTYRHWKATQGSFAETMWRLRQVRRREFALVGRAMRRDFDPAQADVILGRLWREGSLERALAADPALPSRPIVRRWRREQPEFGRQVEAVLAACRRANARRRKRPPSRWPDDLDGQIAARVYAGETLAAIARDPQMPSSFTLKKWMAHRPAFATLIHAARNDRKADVLAVKAERLEAAGR